MLEHGLEKKLRKNKKTERIKSIKLHVDDETRMNETKTLPNIQVCKHKQALTPAYIENERERVLEYERERERVRDCARARESKRESVGIRVGERQRAIESKTVCVCL